VSAVAGAAVARRELTLRAVAMGGAIGVMLAAGNVYTALKIGFIDGGSISAAVLGFTFFAIFRRFARTPYTALENNITQTTAASAAVMGFVLGVGGPLTALTLMGRSYPPWQLCLWCIALAIPSIFLGAALRKKLVVDEALPFPTGAATGEVIETIFTTRESALHRARFLTISGLFAMYVTWFRDGPWAFLPQSIALPVTLAGVSAARLTVAVSCSPLLVSTGGFIGLRAAGSMLIGAAVSWLLVAPWLLRSGIAETASYGTLVSWMVWPGLGLMMASTLVPLVLDWRSVARSFGDLTSMLRTNSAARSGAAYSDRTVRAFRFQKIILGGCLLLLVWVGWRAFGLHPVNTLLAVAASVILAGVCARAAGETDIAPVGSIGMMMQLVFGGWGYGPVASLMSGAVAQGGASQVAQTLWGLKAGHRFKASPRAQVAAQIIGAILGSLVVVPVYLVIVRAYGVGTEAMPTPTAMSWKATAEAMRGGLSAMPPYGLIAGGIGFAVGLVLSSLAQTRAGRFVPSPTAIGIAMLLPASLSATVFIGAALMALVKRRWPAISDGAVTSIAAGGIAGESIMGVVIAILIAFGAL
jgi:OPT family oligopeptide transporter